MCNCRSHHDRAISRRHCLEQILGGALMLQALSGRALAAATQDNWRLCDKCSAMFYNGYPNKGRCAAGGGHHAKGNNFLLTYDTPDTPKAQGAWRYCNKCHTLFFDGYAQKGVCAAGGGHTAAGFVFVLPHDIAVRGLNEGMWRYCNKCHSQFYNGDSGKGRCPAGAGHVAQGFNFVLRFRGNLEGDVQLNPVPN